MTMRRVAFCAVGRGVQLSLLVLLVLRCSTARTPAEEWQWGDDVDGHMGLATRGIFATELFNLDYFFVVFKVMGALVVPLRTVRGAVGLLDSATSSLRDGDDATVHGLLSTANGLADVQTAIERLGALLPSAAFRTDIPGGLPALTLARYLGRRTNVSKNNPTPKQPHTGCLASIPNDGGAVALLTKLAAQAEGDEAVAARQQLALACGCISKKVSLLLEDVEKHKYGHSKSISLVGHSVVSVAQAFVNCFDAAFKAEQLVGWPLENALLEFNDETSALLQRNRDVVERFRGIIARPASDHEVYAQHEKPLIDEFRRIGLLTCRYSDDDCGDGGDGALKKSWLAQASSHRHGPWADELRGFGPMQHECVFHGDEADCSYWMDPLHQKLRVYGTF
jgi:hypothetical protein